ncbi:MAG: YihY/virulence factor BrkB family protein [Acidobacteriota bacterium]
MNTQPSITVPPKLIRLLPRSMRVPVRVFIRALSRWIDEGGVQLGASIAFYTMFALAPLLIIAIAVAGAVFGLEAAQGRVVGQIRGLIGETAAQGVEALLVSAWHHPDTLQATIIGTVTLLIGATGVFTELRRALNMIGQVQPHESALGALVRARLTGLALVLGMGFLSIASLIVSAGLQAFNDLLAGRGPWSYVFESLDLVISVAVLTVAFSALLRWLPDRPPKWRSAIWGGISCAVLFTVGKYLIGVYLTHASVASSYGAAGSFVVVMLWAYYSAQILLFGGAVAAALDGVTPPRVQTSDN